MNSTPHSAQFRNLTKRLLLVFSSDEAIPRMSAQDIDHYSELALFHDIGKRAIPQAILNKPSSLTPKEFSIMKILMSAPGTIVSKETLIQKAWGVTSSAGDNNVEAYISFLRKKLAFLESQVHIHSARKVGYYLEVGGGAA